MRLSWTKCVGGLLLVAGCQSGETGAPDKAPEPAPAATGETQTSAEPSVAKTDDAQAVAALEALTKGLKRDGEGCVIEVDFRGATIDDGALAHLSGLQRVRSVVLAETGITDTGLKTLGAVPTLQCKITNAETAY